MQAPTPQRIRKIRRSLGLSQENFGNILGAAGATVQQWEHGECIPVGLRRQTLLLLERALPDPALKLIVCDSRARDPLFVLYKLLDRLYRDRSLKSTPKTIRCKMETNISATEVRRLRKSMGYSQEEFARFLQVTFQTLNRWESGRNVPSGVHLGILLLLRWNLTSRSFRALLNDPQSADSTFVLYRVLQSCYGASRSNRMNLSSKVSGSKQKVVPARPKHRIAFHTDPDLSSGWSIRKSRR